MVDEPDDALDNRIGMHIIATHMHAQADNGDSLPQIDVPSYTKEQMQMYIKYIRCIKPEISAGVSFANRTKFVHLVPALVLHVLN